MTIAYKLFRVRRDGTLGPLFVERDRVIPTATWVKAKSIKVKDRAYRPGWHACATPDAPHLSTKGRRWCRVILKDVKKHERPEAQGGLWFVAKQMIVVDWSGAC